MMIERDLFIALAEEPVCAFTSLLGWNLTLLDCFCKKISFRFNKNAWALGTRNGSFETDSEITVAGSRAASA
jgi:hypothetical protein